MSNGNVVRLSGVWLLRVALVLLGLFLFLEAGDGAHAATATVTATGRATYINDSGVEVGIKNARVSLYDTEWFFPCGPTLGICHTLMGPPGVTDDNGFFTIVGTGDDGPFGDLPDPYITIEARGPQGSVYPINLPFVTPYCFKSNYFNDAADGSTLNFGTIRPDVQGIAPLQQGAGGCNAGEAVAGDHAAYQLSNNIFEAWSFMRGFTLVNPGLDVPPVSVFWPDPLGDAFGTTFYLPPPWAGQGGISVVAKDPDGAGSLPADQWDEAVIFHEYGHHIMAHFAESPTPNYNNGNCDGIAFLAFGGHCVWWPELGAVHWTEGWPDYLSQVLTTFLGKNNTASQVWGCDPITFACGSFETPPHLGGSHPNNTFDRIEGYTAAILWDMHDAASDDHDGNGIRDRMSEGFGTQWNLLMNFDPDPGNPSHNHITDIHEFWMGMFLQRPDLANRLSAVYGENHIPKPGANLFVNAVSNPPANATTGGSFSASDTTCNGGTLRTGEGTTTLYSLSVLPTGGTTYNLGTRAVVDLVSGGCSASGSVQLNIPSMPPGSYYLRACANADSLIFEDNFTDDCRASGTTVNVQPPAPPDLFVESIVANPAQPDVGQTVTITATVRNLGQTAANNFYVDVYPDSAGPPGGLSSLFCGGNSVPAGGTGTCAVNTSYGSAGAYNMWAWADSFGNAIAEANESNNIGGPVPITVGKPDLVVDSIVANPATPQAGQPVALTITVRNAGTVPAGPPTCQAEPCFKVGICRGTGINCLFTFDEGAAFYIDFYKDRQTPPTVNDGGDAYCAIVSLAAGATTSCTFDANYSTSLISAQFNMYAQVDFRNYIANESNEANNVLGPQVLHVQTPDDDGDLTNNNFDNCPSLYNSNQANTDGDTHGNACDNCPATPNGAVESAVLGVGNQLDADNDGVVGQQPPAGATWGGDACDVDDDNDAKPDTMDGCRTDAEDYDQFEDGDGCRDSDNDGDGVCDSGQTSVSCTGSDIGKFCFDPAGTLFCHQAPATDCRNVDEDIDGFHDGDGCPDFDNDNDGFTDPVDQCPGVDWQAGPDGMFGSPQDLNHNGVRDNPPEGVFTTDDILLAFEDRDGVLDTDGCHDSPGEDFDGDGYADDVEAKNIGTNAGYPCGLNGWPSNLFDNPNGAIPTVNELTIQDILSFVAPVRHFGTSPNTPNTLYDKRWDLLPGPGTLGDYINIQDLIATIAQTPTGYPPMLNGTRAFGQACPLPPQ